MSFERFENIDSLLEQGLDFSETTPTTDEHRYRKLSKGRLSVKLFSEESYNGPRLEDFQKRLKALYETSLLIIEQSNLSAVQKENLKAELEQSRLSAEEKINRDCIIPYIPLKDLADEQGMVVEKIDIAAGYLRQFVADALPLVYPDKSIKKALKDFQKAEAEYIPQEVNVPISLIFMK